jgi:hypothetical protein
MNYEMTKSDRVYFYVNGPSRLLMAGVIANEQYKQAEKHLILLDQFGYNYDRLLPVLGNDFKSINRLKLRARKYSHINQFFSCYFGRFSGLRHVFKPRSDVILFGLRSPAQKFIIRYNKALKNRVLIYAESLAVDKYFLSGRGDGWTTRFLRRLFRRAFDYQRDYDVFYLFCKDVYAGSPYSGNIEQMYDLFGSKTFYRYAKKLTSHLDIIALAQHEIVLLGQPLSNFDNVIQRADEEKLLMDIVGDHKVLVLPHPNEILKDDNKYNVLPNATVLIEKVPSDLILALIKPRKTVTFSSTIGVTYALSNPNAESYFFPIFRSQAAMLSRYKEHVPNMVIDESHVLG